MSRSHYKNPVFKCIDNRSKSKRHYHRLFRRHEADSIRRGEMPPCKYSEVFDIFKILDYRCYVSPISGEAYYSRK